MEATQTDTRPQEFRPACDAPRFVPSPVEIAAVPDDVAACAADSPPGTNVAGPAGALDPARLSRAGKVDALVALARQIAWLQARQQRVLAELAGPAAPGQDFDLQDDPLAGVRDADSARARLDKEWVKEDVRAALGESAIGAGERIRLARELTGRLRPTLSALEQGRVTLRHARYLVGALTGHDDATAAQVQDRVLPVPVTTDPSPDMARFRRRVRREIHCADARTAEQRRTDALADRRVSVLDNGDGTSSQFSLLPTEGAATLMAALNLLAAHPEPGDARSADQRRADALVRLAQDALTGGRNCPHCGGERTGRRPGPAVHVTVALSTVLGYDDDTGELNGEPIPGSLARRIAADPHSTWRRLVTDELGHLVDYGRSTYRPPADLARHVTAHDRTCVFPTCNRRAVTCELDHTVDWTPAGRTNAGNLAALCPRHHHAKHEAGWRYRRLPDGAYHWRSPDGHTYRVPAAAYPVDHSAGDADPDPPEP